MSGVNYDSFYGFIANVIINMTNQKEALSIEVDMSIEVDILMARVDKMFPYGIFYTKDVIYKMMYASDTQKHVQMTASFVYVLFCEKIQKMRKTQRQHILTELKKYNSEEMPRHRIILDYLTIVLNVQCMTAEHMHTLNNLLDEEWMINAPIQNELDSIVQYCHKIH